MRTNRLLAAAAVLVVLVAAVLWYRSEAATTPGGRDAAQGAGQGGHLTAAPAEPLADVPPQRVLATPEEPGFTCRDEEGNDIADAVRDGLTVLAIQADRTPCAGITIKVGWRKGWGLYGTDTGRTDAAGRFATTVAEFEMLEEITLHHPEFGELRNGQNMLPMASDPRIVCVVVPVMAPVQLRLLDLQGLAIAGGTVKVERKAIDSAPREHALCVDEVVASTDDQGRAVVHLAVGHHEFSAQAPAHRPLQTLVAEIPVGGRSLSLTLLRDDLMHEVAVTVVAPADHTGPVEVGGFSKFVPEHLLAQERTSSKEVYRKFAVSRTDERHCTITVDDLPWRLTAKAAGCDWAWVDLPAGRTAATITLVRLPAKPMARLLCQVVVPGNDRLIPTVRVHERPDFHGSDRQTDRFGRIVIELEPQGRVCVSARASNLPPTIVGPIELKPGDHEVRIELVAPKVIRGRVVDTSGKAVAATVNLLRPAGPLRQLGDGEPCIRAEDSSLGMDDGDFRFLDVGPGTHELYAVPTDFGWPGRVRVEPGDENVVVVLGQGLQGMALVHGTVTEAGSRQPLAGVRVYCGTDTVGAHGHTDAQGRFALALPPGAMTMTAWMRRCVVHRTPMTLAPGELRCDIALLPSTPLFVRVVDTTGKALAGIDVGAVDAAGQTIELVDVFGSPDDTYRTDTSGRVELRGLPDGELRLVLARDEERKTVTVPAGTSRDVPFEVRW